MNSDKSAKRITGIIVFVISFLVYLFSVERSGSLWDCGEFILAAYKLQVVHPPGAPLFLIVGRMFTAVAELVSDNPSDIAFAVNLMSGACTAAAAMFVSWIAYIMGKLAIDGRDRPSDKDERIALMGTGLVAGLTTAFCSSIWFSAVEGEVYAMSTFFTAMTVWAMIEWYNLPNDPKHDRWMLFALFSAGMSIGVHLLSLLTFPALTLLFYYKRFKNITLKGSLIAIASGAVLIGFINKLVIAGIPALWKNLDILMVNGLGLPFHSGLIPTFLILGAIIYLGLRYAHKNGNGYWQQAFVGFALLIISLSTIGVVLVRSNAHPPINMNAPTDATRLLPYLNREQYGERPLLFGPHFNASPIKTTTEDRYGRVGDRYEVVDYKVKPEYKDSDMMLFPRLSHNDAARKSLYKNQWGVGKTGKPSMADNIGFFLRYQVTWMYWRYFMWNFSGRQNGTQGYFPWNEADGNWQTGIKPIDEARLHEMDSMPDSMKRHKASNKYYMLPFLFGILGMIFHYRSRRKDFLAMVMLFLMTGLAIILYSNQPPNEPRERDYVLVGSFFTFAIWIGMAVLAIFKLIKEKANLKGALPAIIASVMVLSAPLIMGFENYDDHSRMKIHAARDYATNFLTPLAPNAIIFTFGDNDTYPLWYVQEVEGVRPDVRIVNLSLIGVDWYINHQRRKLNDSPPVKFTISEDAYRGYKRNQVFFYNPENRMQSLNAARALRFCGERHPLPASSRELESYLPSNKLYIEVDKQKALSSGWVSQSEANRMVDRIPFDYGKKTYLLKGELAVMDIVTSNVHDRPVYFSTTVMPSYLSGMKDYMQLEGIALRVMPFKNNSDAVLGIFGSGRVNKDVCYDAFMNKYKWGNFDKEEAFVDNSYRATQQAMRLSIMRTAQEFLKSGDLKKANDLAKKYFEAFPHMNFPYDAMVVPFVQVLVQGGDADAAKEHLRILATEAQQHMEFYQSLDPELLEPGRGFRDDFGTWSRVISETLSMLNFVKDDTYNSEIRAMLTPYLQTKSLN